MYYKTDIDGFKTILSEEAITPDQYITIYDKVYEDDNSLFKVKSVKGNKLNLGLVKVLPLSVISGEHEFKDSQLYQFEDIILYTDARVNKNQVISFNNNFYQVKDIAKQDGPKSLVLEKIEFLTTNNVYTIYKQSEEGYELFQLIPNYREAIIQLANLREQNDGSFYRFI